jgi:hypothetical protein
MRSSHMRKTERDREARQVLESPVRFAEVLLGHQVLPNQEEILNSVLKYPRTAVKACHASGKTFTASEVALWWITRHPDGIAITTAPTANQMEHVLWQEIRRASNGARIAYPKPTATSIYMSPGRYALGVATNEGVRFQGYHGTVLVVLDEAPGIRPEIWEAIEGIRAGGDVRVLALGNPTIASGPFYDAFTTQREGWNLITIGALIRPTSPA